MTVAKRRIAIAVPARDEARRIGACLDRLCALERDARHERPIVVVAANNCRDRTASVAAAHGAIAVSVTLPPERAHAGWARRVALEAAAAVLGAANDILLCTDADTLVAPDWLRRTIDHLDAGWDAVAGLARLDPRELRRLTRPHRMRLALVRRYGQALDRLKARQHGSEPWPRHYYEGGASIAMTLRAFRELGAAPTPRVGEDKALFEEIRRRGGRVRHPLDVKVTTSARLDGRAEGGASDTLALWGRQDEDEPIWGVPTIAAALGFSAGGAGDVTFRTLKEETDKARGLIAMARKGVDLALTG
jgi:cellulose synthase/poly-beta-1,6-N-acetylglucosamine synthase-like glycosyltransferase